jgi:hypothetical protein
MSFLKIEDNVLIAKKLPNFYKFFQEALFILYIEEVTPYVSCRQLSNIYIYIYISHTSIELKLNPYKYTTKHSASHSTYFK